MDQVALSPFPPSFDDNPWSYGFALFSAVLISSLCLAHLLGYAFDYHRTLEADRKRGTARRARFLNFGSAECVYRMIVGGLLTALLVRVLPDAVVMLAWGEASSETMTILFGIDRYLDGLAIIPFIFSSLLLVWSSQAIPDGLMAEAQNRLAPPRWEMLRNRGKIALVVLVIAVGVTLGKAGIAP